MNPIWMDVRNGERYPVFDTFSGTSGLASGGTRAC
jgi:hypothetical protein